MPPRKRNRLFAHPPTQETIGATMTEVRVAASENMGAAVKPGAVATPRTLGWRPPKSRKGGARVVRATWAGKAVTIEDLATGLALPGPALFRRGTRPFVCRLVKLGGQHVPVAVERVEGRVAPERLLAEVKVACDIAREVLKAGGLRLKSLRKGFGLGARLLAVPEGESG